MTKQDNRVTSMPTTEHYFDKTYGLNAPENYERFFVPAIGEPVAKDLIRHSVLEKGERVLDVACGTGVVARLASQRVGHTGSVTGLDINPGMLGVARSISKDTPIEWHEASAEDMPLPDEAFDLVLCQLGLQFMEDKPAALREMQRVLVPGGRLVLNVPGPAGQLFTIFAEAMERNISSSAAEFINHVFALHDTAELRRLISDANFKDIETDARTKIFHLPSPKEFLWQYIRSTPLIELMVEMDKDALLSLEQDIIGKWQDFEEDGTMIYQQRIIIASALK